MELKKKKLLKEHKKAIEKIGNMLKEGNFYLAGGTGVYYYLQHRHSVDLDFFTDKVIDFREFHHYFEPEEIKLLTKDTIHAKVENINLSFFQYPYLLLKPPNNLEMIKIASLEDILCMKANNIISRGSRKDFVDVYFIIKALKVGSDEVINLFKKKFGAYDELVIKKSLTYFEDAEKEPEFTTIKKINWEKIKNFFIKEFGKI